MKQLELFPVTKCYKVTETVVKNGDVICRKIKRFDNLSLALDAFKVGVFILKRNSMIEVVYR